LDVSIISLSLGATYSEESLVEYFEGNPNP
jgi:hypothetical protein